MRASGILMHISSLPSNYGIGTLGQEAYNFVDFLKKSGQTYWQILPICPTGFGDSPYQTFSSYAGNPYFIDLDFLIADGLLQKNECSSIKWSLKNTSVDYKRMYDNRYKVLKKAYNRFIKSPPKEFEKFCNSEKYWLDDYALFMAIKTQTDEVWNNWDEDLKFREKNAIKDFENKNSDDVMFYKVIQYLFFLQWHRLKEYANQNGIKIIGDIPIYVASDSVDVWKNPELFLLNNENEPTCVAGCPPDLFSKNGQLWGNPIYNWDKMKEDGYEWWIRRLKYVSEIYDITRIDHFRGFDSYYTIDAKAKTARKGEWIKGPGIDFFNSIKKELGELNIIAEDLGFLTPSVHKLLKRTGFPGMKVLQFAFDNGKDSDYLPHNYPKNTVVYTGTHDNDTILGWIKTTKKQDVNFAIDYLRLSEEEGYNWGMMKGAWASVANTVIVTMQDLLGLDSDARMNIPSTVGENWKWRASKNSMSNTLAKKINKCMKTYKRV